MFKRIMLTIAVLVFTASYSFAGMVQTFGIGANATAQGEAVSANADDPFAVYYNPAGLVLSERPTLTTGFVYYKPTIEIDNFKAVNESGTDLNAAAGNSNSAELTDSELVNPHMGFSMPITEKLFFGIGAYSPYGLHIKWDKDVADNPGAAYAWESYYARVVLSPTVAYKINDKISVGFGVSLGRSVSEAGKTFTVSPTTISKATGAATVFTNMAAEATTNADNARLAAAAEADPVVAAGYLGAAAIYDEAAAGYTAKATEYTNGAALYTMLNGAHLKLEAEDDFNYSFNFGVMYRPIDELSMGFTYRGRTEANFEGDAIVTGANGGTLDFGGSVTMGYDHPESIQGGVRYFATENLSLEFDMTWTRWSILEKQVEYITFDVPGMGAVPYTADHDRDWEDTIQYKIGAEWNVVENIALRGGYTYDPTPAPAHTFDMGWPDTDRSVFNLGCGWGIGEHWVVDSVLQYIRSTPTRKIEGNSEELNGVYETAFGEPVEVYMEDKGELWGFGLTVSYLF